MSSIAVRVPAKVNLCLGVGPVRDDGFHALATVYQALDIYDEVRVEASADGTDTIHVVAEGPEPSTVPTDHSNLALRAARMLREEFAIDDGVTIHIHKAIPVAGGMAGGSADAAAALVACNELWDLGLTKEDLVPFAARLGSDVPFLLHGGIAIGSGRGEVVNPVLARGSYHWVVAISAEGLSTAAVFAEYDVINAGRKILEPQIPEPLMTALRTGDVDAVGAELSNDLTEAAITLRPELAETLALGRQAGAVAALISGSGPTCLFLARDESQSLDIAIALAGVKTTIDVVQARGPVAGAKVI